MQLASVMLSLCPVSFSHSHTQTQTHRPHVQQVQQHLWHPRHSCTAWTHLQWVYHCRSCYSFSAKVLSSICTKSYYDHQALSRFVFNTQNTCLFITLTPCFKTVRIPVRLQPGPDPFNRRCQDQIWDFLHAKQNTLSPSSAPSPAPREHDSPGGQTGRIPMSPFSDAHR